MNLAEHVLRAGLDVPDGQALVVMGHDDAQVWSHAELRRAVLGTATGLLRAGLRPGDRLLMRLANRPAFPIAYLGAIAAGVVPVPTSAQLTAPEITRIATRIAPAVIVAGAGVPLPDHPAPVLTEDDLDGFATMPPAEFAQGAADRLGYIVFTSGSSGQPRAVMHAHRAILARQAMMQGWYGLRPDDRLLHAGAFNWTFTLGTGLLDPWTLGATALIPAPGTPIEQIPALAARHGATILAGAPGIFRRLLRADWPPIATLRHALAAGERLDPALRAAWTARTGTDIHEAMGASEISTFLSGSPDRPAPPGTAGYPQPGRHVAVLDTDGPGQPGPLAVRADDPGLFLGYLDDPAATRACFRDGWFLTGDLAQAAPNGAITLLGRADDIMNAGGFRIAPPEIEDHLATHPDAGDVAVAELPVAPGVTIVAAFWTGPATPAQMQALAQDGLARYKQPRAWIPLDALPRTPTGKINRRALRAAHRKDLE
ncbi:class I adenylate-forming enzyme family protein [Paracoccus hibiscisoli]|uniref:Acyl--CoA ligase n=1 Tax=Paracoccus hibiscisoli TaxID=2023261 RepID=A0A4U0QML4_9RHOB|nr:class I adenylate-forming enzyme family protein [Paracoccus hibiscisoli]TJZ83083.1 acyl--CoA ligase [Paracoccus hibiscisoli]